jgi:hypothetical protein
MCVSPQAFSERADAMTIITAPAQPEQVIRIFSLPSVREVPLPATPAGSAW